MKINMLILPILPAEFFLKNLTQCVLNILRDAGDI